MTRGNSNSVIVIGDGPAGVSAIYGLLNKDHTGQIFWIGCGSEWGRGDETYAAALPKTVITNAQAPEIIIDPANRNTFSEWRGQTLGQVNNPDTYFPPRSEVGDYSVALAAKLLRLKQVTLVKARAIDIDPHTKTVKVQKNYQRHSIFTADKFGYYHADEIVVASGPQKSNLRLNHLPDAYFFQSPTAPAMRRGIIDQKVKQSNLPVRIAVIGCGAGLLDVSRQIKDFLDAGQVVIDVHARRNRLNDFWSVENCTQDLGVYDLRFLHPVCLIRQNYRDGLFKELFWEEISRAKDKGFKSEDVLRVLLPTETRNEILNIARSWGEVAEAEAFDLIARYHSVVTPKENLGLLQRWQNNGSLNFVEATVQPEDIHYISGVKTGHLEISNRAYDFACWAAPHQRRITAEYLSKTPENHLLGNLYRRGLLACTATGLRVNDGIDNLHFVGPAGDNLWSLEQLARDARLVAGKIQKQAPVAKIQFGAAANNYAYAY